MTNDVILTQDDISVVVIDAENFILSVGEQGPAGPAGGGGGAIGGFPVQPAGLTIGDHLEFSGSNWINVAKTTLSDGGNF